MRKFYPVLNIVQFSYNAFRNIDSKDVHWNLHLDLILKMKYSLGTPSRVWIVLAPLAANLIF